MADGVLRSQEGDHGDLFGAVQAHPMPSELCPHPTLREVRDTGSDRGRTLASRRGLKIRRKGVGTIREDSVLHPDPARSRKGGDVVGPADDRAVARRSRRSWRCSVKRVREAAGDSSGDQRGELETQSVGAPAGRARCDRHPAECPAGRPVASLNRRWLWDDPVFPDRKSLHGALYGNPAMAEGLDFGLNAPGSSATQRGVSDRHETE